MWIGIVSLFPEMFHAVTRFGITRRAVENGLLEIEIWNPRDFAGDKHRTVDDKPYGGGPGMLMKVQPLKDAINAARSQAGADCPVICLSPQGRKLEQADLKKFAKQPNMILVAGRYEGIDERLMETVIDEEISIGDFVVTGGELPAMVLIDGMTRLLPGAVGDSDSVEHDSFSEGLLDYPQYTRPESVDGFEVPAVLMSGDHEKIARWRKQQALGRTYEKRPDLIRSLALSDEDVELLNEYLAKRET
jgi:tRNA (guanine37-N1)-methyltransferase